MREQDKNRHVKIKLSKGDLDLIERALIFYTGNLQANDNEIERADELVDFISEYLDDDSQK